MVFTASKALIAFFITLSVSTSFCAQVDLLEEDFSRDPASIISSALFFITEPSSYFGVQRPQNDGFGFQTGPPDFLPSYSIASSTYLVLREVSEEFIRWNGLPLASGVPHELRLIIRLAHDPSNNATAGNASFSIKPSTDTEWTDVMCFTGGLTMYGCSSASPVSIQLSETEFSIDFNYTGGNMDLRFIASIPNQDIALSYVYLIKDPTPPPTTAAPTTMAPTMAPTTMPPTVAPTTIMPTMAPTTAAPTASPTASPTNVIIPPTAPTVAFPDVEPRVDCVMDNLDGTFTAFLGWTAPEPVEVLVGENNRISSAPQGLPNQPTIFNGTPGFFPTEGLYEFKFDGTSTSWTLGKGVVNFRGGDSSTACKTDAASIALGVSNSFPLGDTLLRTIGDKILQAMGLTDADATTTQAPDASSKRQAATTVTISITSNGGNSGTVATTVASFASNADTLQTTITELNTEGATVTTSPAIVAPTSVVVADRRAAPTSLGHKATVNTLLVLCTVALVVFMY